MQRPWPFHDRKMPASVCSKSRRLTILVLEADGVERCRGNRLGLANVELHRIRRVVGGRHVTGKLDFHLSTLSSSRHQQPSTVSCTIGLVCYHWEMNQLPKCDVKNLRRPEIERSWRADAGFRSSYQQCPKYGRLKFSSRNNQSIDIVNRTYGVLAQLS